MNFLLVPNDMGFAAKGQEVTNLEGSVVVHELYFVLEQDS